MILVAKMTYSFPEELFQNNFKLYNTIIALNLRFYII